MRMQDITLLYDYNYWANGRILAASAKVSLEQFVAPTAHSYGSLRGTLVHTLDAEYAWRELLQHAAFPEELRQDEFPTVDVVAQRWKEDETAMRDYLVSLRDQDLMEVVRYTLPNGEQRARVLWHCLYHVVNHGTQHRSEAAVMLTDYGQSPGDLDLTVFTRESGI
jgi:uncharacterized damage-inducible protein DinB